MHSRANGLDQLGGIQPKSDTTGELAKVEGEGFQKLAGALPEEH